MKKSLLLSALFTLFLLSSSPSAFTQEDYPQGDFSLTSGQLRVAHPTEDLSTFEMFFSQTVYIAHLKISKGKVSAGETVPVGYRVGGNQDFDGSGTLNVEGEYDKDTGLITGTFTYSDSEHFVWTNPSLDMVRVGTGEVQFSGKLRGALVGGRAVLIYSGRLTGGGSHQIADGSYRSSTTDTAYTLKVVYGIDLGKGAEGDPEVLDVDLDGMGKDSHVRFSGLSGQVEWKMPNDPPEKWRLCKVDLQIPVGAMIRTDEDSEAILSFADMSTFVMKPETTLIITAPPEKDSKLKLVTGSIWANVKKMMKDGSMDVEMNQAVAGIKGTIFSCEEKDGVSSLRVYQGSVAFTPTGKKAVTVYQGEAASADAAGKVNKEKFDSVAELAQWGTLIASLEPEEEKNVQGPDMSDAPAPSAASGAPSQSEKSNPPMFLVVVVILVLVSAGVVFRRKKK